MVAALLGPERLAAGASCGLVTGMGLIDIWIGVSELLHYRDYKH